MKNFIMNHGRWIIGLFILDCVLLGMLCARGESSARSESRAESMNRQQVRQVMTKEDNREQTEMKKVALTFDDGPNDSYTETLLEGLEERGVKATFFLLGKEAEENPALVKKIYEGGHLIGNHSYSHVNLSELSYEEALIQINQTNQIIYDITGYYPEYIRPPFGRVKEGLSYNPEMIEVLWNVDARDWETDDIGYVVQKVVADVEENGIILLHDASASSVQAAFAIVDILQEQGYNFVTVDEILLD